MKLSDVKKLKVAELRAMLKERGLESKGLKAELVMRFMSAIETELPAPQSSNHAQDTGVPGIGENHMPQNEESSRSGESTVSTMKTDVPLLTKEDNLTGEKGDVLGTSSKTVMSAVPHCPPESSYTEVRAISAAKFDNMSTSQLKDAHVISTFTMGMCMETTTDKVLTEPTSSNQNVQESSRGENDKQEHVTQENAQEQQSKEQVKLPSFIQKSEEKQTTINQQTTANLTSISINNTFSTSHVSLMDISNQHTSMLVVGQLKDHADPAGDNKVEEYNQTIMALGRKSPKLSQTSDQTSQNTGNEKQAGAANKRERPAEGVPAKGRAYYEFKEEIQYNRAKSPPPRADKDWVVADQDEGRVTLDSYGGDLHFEVGQDGCTGQPRFWEHCPLLWSGCRLTHGAHKGRVGFEARFDKKLVSPALDAEDSEPYGLRVGWSADHWNSSMMLGDVDLSYGYDARGKKVTAGKEEEFGEPLSEGDVIGCYASFSKEEGVDLSFHKNGRPMGVAFHLSPAALSGCVLYPHVLCKNTSVTLNLNPISPPWYLGPAGYSPLPSLPADHWIRNANPPTSKQQCEVLMMVGLPGSGKTHWAMAHMNQNPEKRYRLLGTAGLLPCMKGQGRRECRLKQASCCLRELIKVAADTPRNYILDQPNVHPSAQRQRLLWFSGFRRMAVVVFPSTEDWKRRLQKQREVEGEEIPETDLHKVKVSCTLPEQGDLLEKVLFVELAREEAQAVLEEYKKEAKSLLPPVPAAPKRKKPCVKRNNIKPQASYSNKTRFGRMAAREYNPHFRGRPDGWYTPASELRGWGGTWFNQQPYPGSHQQYWGLPRYWNQGYQDQGYYSNKNHGYQDQGYYSNKNLGYQDQGYYGNSNYAYGSYQGY
ncbi:heterogeneous nuclear ribonucleoprotein U-like protein 1 [Esox lucius]|uniref:SAP domain-containing protein n=1 Tax=Esox lucius TaxID=8010 RepID=A0A3P8XS93_ESOLU|nr:heterogeneous nuclear ribonucleoprotein U-like protein 1 [Esox lucius]